MQIPKKSMIIALLALPCIANAQERQAVTKIGANYSVDYAYRTLKTNNSDVYFIVTSRNGMEKPIIGFNAGLTFLHQFKKGLILEGGVQYSRYGEQMKDFTTINTYGEYGKATEINDYDYLSVPIKVGYGLPLGKRITLSASTGLSTHYFLARRFLAEMKYNDGSSEKFKDRYAKEPNGTQFEKFNFVSVSSIGVEIQLFSSFSVRLEPTFRYFLNPIMDAPIKQRPYSYGINTTLFYQFGHSMKKEKSVE